MKQYFVGSILVAAIFVPFAAVASPESSWPIGVEREVDEGMYMSVVAQRFGWRIWRVEDMNGVSFRAVKSARGRPDPIPVGVGPSFFRGTPFLVVMLLPSTSNKPEWYYSWKTVHLGDVRVQVRLPGERFWTQWKSSNMETDLFDEKAVELVAESWEYPALNSGRAEEQAVFDLVGITWAKEQLRQYAAEIDQATAANSAPIIPAPTCPPTAPKKLRSFNIERAYPQRAIDQGIEADVTGDVLVAADGTVSDVQVQRTEQNNIFVDGFIREARRLAFSPATSGCKPIIANYRLSVSFKLGE